MVEMTDNGTQLAVRQTVKEATIRFSVTLDNVGPMVEKCLALKIGGVDDKQGIATVREARQAVRKARTTVEAERVAAKAEYLKAGREVDAAAKNITSQLEPAEEHLVQLLDEVDKENQRLFDEKLDKQLNFRLRDLDGVGGIPSIVANEFPLTAVRAMTEERFKQFVGEMSAMNKRLSDEAEQRRQLEEKNRLEAERIAEERAELDRLRKAEADRQAAEQRRLDEERRAENERLALERRAAEKKYDEELAEKRRLADEERKANEAILNEQRRVAAEEHRKLEEQRAEQRREADRIEADRRKLAEEREAKLRAEEDAMLERQRLAEAEAKRVEDDKAKAESLPVREKIIAYRDALLAVVTPKMTGRFSAHGSSIKDLQDVIKDRLTNLASSLERKSK